MPALIGAMLGRNFMYTWLGRAGSGVYASQISASTPRDSPAAGSITCGKKRSFFSASK
jgi:hypothetical protein